MQIPNFQITSSMRGNKSRRSWSAVDKSDLLVDIFSCKWKFCCKYVTKTVLLAVQCICIHLIAGYIIEIELIACA